MKNTKKPNTNLAIYYSGSFLGTDADPRIFGIKPKKIVLQSNGKGGFYTPYGV